MLSASLSWGTAAGVPYHLCCCARDTGSWHLWLLLLGCNELSQSKHGCLFHCCLFGFSDSQWLNDRGTGNCVRTSGRAPGGGGVEIGSER